MNYKEEKELNLLIGQLQGERDDFVNIHVHSERDPIKRINAGREVSRIDRQIMDIKSKIARIDVTPKPNRDEIELALVTARGDYNHQRRLKRVMRIGPVFGVGVLVVSTFVPAIGLLHCLVALAVLLISGVYWFSAAVDAPAIHRVKVEQLERKLYDAMIQED